MQWPPIRLALPTEAELIAAGLQALATSPGGDRRRVAVVTAAAETLFAVAATHPLATDDRPPTLVDPADPLVARLLTLAGVGLALGAGEAGLVRPILATVLGADEVGASLRHQLAELLSERPAPGPPAEMDPAVAQDWVWGDLQQALTELSEAGRAASDVSKRLASAEAWSAGIESIEPFHACAGDTVVIRGKGFGWRSQPGTTVRWPVGDGVWTDAAITRTPPPASPGAQPPATLEPAPQPGDAIRRPFGPADLQLADGWSDQAIAVVVPEQATSGVVGFLRYPDGAGPAPVEVQAAREALQQALDRLVAIGSAHVAGSAVRQLAPLSTATELLTWDAPPFLALDPAPDGRIPNSFGGRQLTLIRSFTASAGGATGDRLEVTSGSNIELRWEVEHSISVAISGGGDVETLPGEDESPLPRLHGVLPAAGTLAVTARRTRPGEATVTYRLLAIGPCGDAEASVRITVKEAAPLWGLADTHSHFVAQYALGGLGVWGRTHSPPLPTELNPGLNLPTDALSELDLAVSLRPCHGPGGHFSVVGTTINLDGASNHPADGYPTFAHWPTHLGKSHQQVHLSWLKRAVDGGLRLAVCLAVNNEAWATESVVPPFVLAKRGKREPDDELTRAAGGYPTDDAGSIRLQLAAMEALVARVDADNNGDGWVKLARNPQEARRIIAAGKLALVPGVEVPSLGGWYSVDDLDRAALLASRTPQALIAQLLDDLYARGVRHLFPVHALDNAFGGGGIFTRNYQTVATATNKRPLAVESAPVQDGVAYRLDQDEFSGGGLGEFFAGAATPESWRAASGGHRNPTGLTRHGRVLAEELMARGMIIDVDHLGIRGLDQLLAMCERVRYPVVSGHTQFREQKLGWRPELVRRAQEQLQFSVQSPPELVRTLTFDKDSDGITMLFGTADGSRLATEIDKTAADVRRIRDLGGMVSPILIQPEPRQYAPSTVPGVDATSSGSARSLAQALLYAWEQSGGRGIGFGSDINGAAEMPGPRFGPNASDAIAKQASRKVREREQDPSFIGRRLSRRAEALGQTRGVRYSRPLRTVLANPVPHDGADRLFTDLETDIWMALCVQAQGLSDASVLSGRARMFLRGLRGSPGQPLGGLGSDERAAFLAVNPQRATGNESAEDKNLISRVTTFRDHFNEAELGAPNVLPPALAARLGPSGSGLYDGANRLHRCTSGQRDWDLNTDGMAHYGLLPDLIQDLRNVGLDERVLDTMYRSADHYVGLWERCERLAATSGLRSISARPEGLSLTAAMPEGHYLVVTEPSGGVRTLFRNPGGGWQDHALTGSPTDLVGGPETSGGGPVYPVASVIDRRGRGWLCRLERQAAWLTPDLNGTLPVVAMVVVEYPAQTDLYGLTGNGTLVGSTLRHGPDVSTAPTPWSPLGGQALVGTGSGFHAFGDATGEHYLVVVTAAGELMVSRRRPSAAADLDWWRHAERRYLPGSTPAGVVTGPGRLRLLVQEKAGPVVLDLDLERDRTTVRPLPIGLTAGLRPALANGRIFVVDGNGRLLTHSLHAITEPWYELHSRLAPRSRVAASPIDGQGTLLAVTDADGRVWTTIWTQQNRHSGWLPLPH